jgi:phenylalanyl-tRNA synthetase alpha subunit
MFGKSKFFASVLLPFTEPSAEIDIWGLKPKRITESQKEPVG